MIQSCITNDQFDEIFDRKKEDQIRADLSPSEPGSNKQLETISSYIGK